MPERISSRFGRTQRRMREAWLSSRCIELCHLRRCEMDAYTSSLRLPMPFAKAARGNGKSRNRSFGDCSDASQEMQNRNRGLLIEAARLLQSLLQEVVFVGGTTTVLMITDPGAADVRTTYDVDVIVGITSYAQYAAFGRRLRTLGFQEDASEGAPICRWRHPTRIALDVMPTDEKILGFSNRWYSDAIANAQWLEIEQGLTIRVVTSPYFCATKLEAFRGRGHGDHAASKDLEDLIAVVDGRKELIDEINGAESAVRSYVAAQVRTLLRNLAFLDALPGFLLPDAGSQGRHDLLMSRLRAIAEL